MVVNMMSQKAPDNIVTLMKIKSWYIPADVHTYQVLRELKIPLLKFHKDFVPVLLLRMKSAKFRVKAKTFQETLDAYLDKVGEQWQSKPNRKARMNPTRLVFRAPLTVKNKEAVQKLDIALAKFFERWAFRYIATYSAEGDRLKFVVDYSFDPQRNPVIHAVEPAQKEVFEMVLGFTKIRFTFHHKREQKLETKTRGLPPVIQTEVFQQAGSDWRQTFTSTCVDAQIGDPSQFIAAMGLFHARYINES